MARLHRENRYDRSTNDVEQVTGQPPQTIEQYVASHPDLFASVPCRWTFAAIPHWRRPPKSAEYLHHHRCARPGSLWHRSEVH